MVLQLKLVAEESKTMVKKRTLTEAVDKERSIETKGMKFCTD